MNDELKSFVAYCEAHPQLRFWQALRNWSGWNFVFVSDKSGGLDLLDTFYMKGRKDSE